MFLIHFLVISKTEKYIYTLFPFLRASNCLSQSQKQRQNVTAHKVPPQPCKMHLIPHFNQIFQEPRKTQKYKIVTLMEKSD